MQIVAFNATCPFEIGDKVVIHEAVEPNEERIRYTEREGTITDIACTHYLKSGKVIFAYELDGSGKYESFKRSEEAGLTV